MTYTSVRPLVGTMQQVSRSPLPNPTPAPRSTRSDRHSVCRIVGFIFATLLSAHATEFYVAPTGSSAGSGSQTSPWDLQTALNQPATVKPGDTIWLRGGTYAGNFDSKLVGTATAPIIVRQYPGERAKIADPATTAHTAALTLPNSSYTWYWGFEVCSSTVNRYSATATSRSSAPWPTPSGVDTENSGRGNRLINMLVHDNPREGIGAWTGSTDMEIYGCLVFYNGWVGATQPYEHGIYTQNDSTGYKKIRDTFMYNNAESGMQVYGSATAAIANYTVDGNISFNNGQLLASFMGGKNLLVGGGCVAQNPIVTANYLYRSPNAGGGSSDFYIGYTAGTQNALVRSNYVVNTSLFNSSEPGLTMDNNYYCGALSGISQSSYPNNTYTTTRPTTGAKVVVRANAYEAGRANIAIYNWAQASSVSVDLTSVGLKAGDTYELHNVMDYYKDIVTGTLAGTTLSVPMTGHTVASPSGLATPPSPFPGFGAFVIIKTGTSTPPANTAASGRSPNTVNPISAPQII